jgi:putative transport protein
MPELAQVVVDADRILKNDMALLFLIIGLGFFVGKLKIRGFELGPSVGVLFVALYFGHRGYKLPEILGTLGFIFFIYSVGFQSGPRFFPAFKENGLRFVALGSVMTATAALASWAMCVLFGLSRGHLIGIMGGSLTTISGVAAANTLLKTPGAVALPAGASAVQLEQDSTLAFAITSVYGLVGLLFIIQALPRLLGLDLAQEAQKLEDARRSRGSTRIGDVDDERRLGPKGPPQARTYRVTNPAAIEKTLVELKFAQSTGAVLVTLRRGNTLGQPGPKTKLEKGDTVLALGYVAAHEKLRAFLGEECVDDLLSEVRIDTASVVVTSPRVIGQTILDCGIVNRFACTLFQVRREGLELPVALDLRLEKGDQVVIAGPVSQLAACAKEIGRPEGAIHETDLLTFAFGIFFGLVLGMVELNTEGSSVGFPVLGSAGGLLLLGLLVGYLRYQHPVFGRVPPAARYLLLELGLLLFMAELGTRAGATIIQGFRSAGLGIFLSGVVVTSAPVLVGYLFGRKVLGFDPVTLLGAITGGMINTPALGVVNQKARSNLPAIGYAGVYAFATIVVTVAGPLILKL